MREQDFTAWMAKTGNKGNSTMRKTQITDMKRIEFVYGDLDKHYDNDRIQSIIEKLSYSKEDVMNKRNYHSEMEFRPRVPKSDESYYPKLKGIFDNSRTLVQRYRKFCDAIPPSSAYNIPAIAGDAAEFDPRSIEDARKKIYRSIVARRGQSQFRAELCRAYRNACAISGCSVLDVLEAAHIAPYLGSHTNLVTNGLLLRTDLHTLFDCGLIAIEPINLIIIVKPWLLDSIYGQFHLQNLRHPIDKSSGPNREALRQHKEEVYDPRVA